MPRVRGGRGFSRSKKVVARKLRKIAAPDRRKVERMPIRGGSTPPISGPTRLPAMMPDDKRPSAQPDLAFGVWAATRIIEPEA